MELIAQTTPATVRRPRAGFRRREAPGREYSASFRRNPPRRRGCLPSHTMQHEHDIHSRRKRASTPPFVRNPAGAGPGRVRRSRRAAARPPLASNPRCAAAAQPRGLFGSERPLAAWSMDPRCLVYRGGGGVDRRRRRVCRTGTQRQVRERQRRSATGRLGDAGADLLTGTPALSARRGYRSTRSIPPRVAAATYSGNHCGPSTWRAISTTM